MQFPAGPLTINGIARGRELCLASTASGFDSPRFHSSARRQVPMHTANGTRDRARTRVVSCTHDNRVQLPAVPLRREGFGEPAGGPQHSKLSPVGSWSRRYDAGMACRQPGFDSRRVHSVELCATVAGRGVRTKVRPTGVRSKPPRQLKRRAITTRLRTGAGYGWPGRGANAVAPHGA